MTNNIYKNLLTNNLICRGIYHVKKKHAKSTHEDHRDKKIKSNKAGFTLIELLVVIAIIGVLATLLMVNFIGVRQRARDAARKSDVSQIQAALEQYRADQGDYPSTFPNCGSSFTSSDASTVYMQKIPCDPLGSTYYNSGNYYYSFNSSNHTYSISACLENSSDGQGTSTSPGGSGCTTNYYYTATNP